MRSLMEMSEGYTTFIVNFMAAIVAVAALLGVIIPQDESTAISAGLLAVINIVLRFKTKTPVFTKSVRYGSRNGRW